MTTIVVHNRDWPEILKNFLIEHMPKTILEGLDLLENLFGLSFIIA